MGGTFDRRSLAIVVDAEAMPWDRDYLVEPRRFANPAVRVYLHETLHFWQVLSQGFMANLALAEWRELTAFEATGELPAGDAFARAYARPHPELGFSAWNLSEALARYWDMHIVGPGRLWRRHLLAEEERDDPALDDHLVLGSGHGYSDVSFDALMQWEDAYAAPYRLALERWGSNTSVILFPLVGHFAMQTPSPVEVFAEAVKRLADRLNLNTGRLDIHAAWREHFDTVRKVCLETTLAVSGLIDLTPGWDVINRSALAEHPIYAHYLELMIGVFAIWGRATPFYFALPGDPDCRAKLANTFRAPITRLHGGRWTGETGISKLFWMRAGRDSRLREAEELADEAEAIWQRGRAFQQARALTRLKAIARA